MSKYKFSITIKDYEENGDWRMCLDTNFECGNRNFVSGMMNVEGIEKLNSGRYHICIMVPKMFSCSEVEEKLSLYVVNYMSELWQKDGGNRLPVQEFFDTKKSGEVDPMFSAVQYERGMSEPANEFEGYNEQRLNNILNVAVRKEDYERAAVIRDAIIKLRS